MAILGSRDQYCIKPEFQKYRGVQLNQACEKVIGGAKKQGSIPLNAENSCQYFSKDHLMYLAGQHNRDVMDIEEVKSFGRHRKCCPYFFERNRKEAADLVLMPYNYLLGR